MLKRKGLVSIDTVFKAFGSGLNSMVRIDGDFIRNSQRYRLFFQKGITCVECGIVGQYFAKERESTHYIGCGWHLNLYAVDETGKERLMTRDHIVPKSKGGPNTMANLQPMCWVCNMTKGDK